MAAKERRYPVILLDRRVDPVAKPGRDTSPSSAQILSMRANEPGNGWPRPPKGKQTIIELEGTTGSSPANDRKKGFDEEIKSILI